MISNFNRSYEISTNFSLSLWNKRSFPIELPHGSGFGQLLQCLDFTRLQYTIKAVVEFNTRVVEWSVISSRFGWFLLAIQAAERACERMKDINIVRRAIGHIKL